jgi:hypothetical protein
MAEVTVVRRMLSVAGTPASDPNVEARELESGTAPQGDSRQWRAGWVFRALSLAPFGVLPLSWVLSPTYFGGMFSAPPDILGIPLDLILDIVFLALGGLGSALVWRARSRRVVYAAFVLCTLPATFGLIMTPAAILIMQNLRV